MPYREGFSSHEVTFSSVTQMVTEIGCKSTENAGDIQLLEVLKNKKSWCKSTENAGGMQHMGIVEVRNEGFELLNLPVTCN